MCEREWVREWVRVCVWERVSAWVRACVRALSSSFFVTMYITIHRIIMIPFPFYVLRSEICSLHYKFYWRFYYLFYFWKHMFYKYKEASKQHLFYFAITLDQNICLSYDFGQNSECLYYKFAANSVQCSINNQTCLCTHGVLSPIVIFWILSKYKGVWVYIFLNKFLNQSYCLNEFYHPTFLHIVFTNICTHT